MAANCVYIRNGDPVPAVGETFVSCDEDIKIEVESGNGFPGNGGCYFGDGKLYVTDRRLLFIRAGPNTQFNSFSIPFALLQKIKIKTPFLSSAYISGETKPINHGGLNGNGRFILRFGNSELMRSVYNLAQQQWKDYKAAVDKAPYERVAQMTMLPIHEIFQEQFPEQAHNVRENVIQRSALPVQVRQNTIPVLNTSVQNGAPTVARISSMMENTRLDNQQYGLIASNNQGEEEVQPARSSPYSVPDANRYPSNYNGSPAFVNPSSRPDLFANQVANPDPNIGSNFVNPNTRPDLFNSSRRPENSIPDSHEGSTSTRINSRQPRFSNNPAATPSNHLNQIVGHAAQGRPNQQIGANPASQNVDVRGEGEDDNAYFDENNTGDIVVQFG